MDRVRSLFGGAKQHARLDDGEPGEEEPLLAGDSEEASSNTADIANKPAQRNSAIVRHGRGLLSEDDEADDDEINDRSGLFRSSRSSGPGGDGDSIDALLARRSGKRRGKWRTLLCYTFLFILGICFVAFAVVHIWIGRFMSEQLRDDAALLKQRAPDALVWRGPDKIKILSMDSETTTVQIDMRMGLDVRTVFGWNESVTSISASEGTRPRISSAKLPLSRRLERRIIGWATRQVKQASVDLPAPMLIMDANDKLNRPIMAIGLADPITLPLHFAKSDDYDTSDVSWLRNISLVVPAEVVNPDLMAAFVNQTMENKHAAVHVDVQTAHLTLGREDDRHWLTRTVRRYGGRSVENVNVEQEFDVPDSPDMPNPDDLVELKSYSLVAIPNNSTHHNRTTPVNETLAVHATARIQNPGYEEMHKYALDLDIPFAWPYKLFLPSNSSKAQPDKPDLVLLARGVVEPFSIPSNSKHFDVSINATVEQTLNSSTPLADSLGKFISRFMAGKSNRVYLAYDPESPYARKIPAFLSPLLEPLIVPNDVPGLPPDQRELLKDLQMKNLRVHGSETGSGGWECDGEMQGEMIMPKGLDQLEGGINITEIWPDIILYDGLPPPNTGNSMPPVPLPSNAFARFKTRDWAPALTYVDPATNKTYMKAVTRNVPLDIVRSDVLQKWIAKIIFSGGRGALTGVKGQTQARSTVRGFGQVELHKLPVFGTFYANKPNLMSLPSLFGDDTADTE